MFLRNLWLSSNRFITTKQMHSQPLAKMTEQVLKAVVMHDGGEDKVYIKITYNTGIKIRSFNLLRDPNEKVSLAFLRLERSILEHSTAKYKKKRKHLENEVPNIKRVNIKLLKSPVVVTNENINLDKLDLSEVSTEECSTMEAFVTEGDRHLLQIEDQYYAFDINPPTVASASLPDSIMVGYLLYPNNLDIRFGSVENCLVTWYLSTKVFEDYLQAKARMNSVQWEPVHEGFLLKTTEEMKQKLLKVVIEPREGERRGAKFEAVATALVTDGPQNCPYLARHRHTPTQLLEHSIRVVSYNLLADTYASTAFSAEHLFPTCPSYALDMAYRKQLLMDEIIGYHADVLCLQEVDQHFFKYDLSRVLGLQCPPLHGVYSGKLSDSTKEGPAVFYNAHKFRLLEALKYGICEELSSNPALADMWSKVESNEQLKERVVGRNTVFLTCVLERLVPSSSMEDFQAGEGKNIRGEDSHIVATKTFSSSPEKCINDQEKAAKSLEKDAENIINDSNKTEKESHSLETNANTSEMDKISQSTDSNILEQDIASVKNYTRTTDSAESTPEKKLNNPEENTKVPEEDTLVTVWNKELLVVGNSHFYFHPDADHIRLVQAAVCFQLLQQLVHRLERQGNRVRVVFCGDLNSTPDTGVYELATTGRVDHTHPGWASVPEEAVCGMSSSHGLNMASACGSPQYTNYAVTFNGCLDWIFYQRDQFAVSQVVDLPSHEEVTAHTALPSITIPSDHLALVADLNFTP